MRVVPFPLVRVNSALGRGVSSGVVLQRLQAYVHALRRQRVKAERVRHKNGLWL